MNEDIPPIEGTYPDPSLNYKPVPKEIIRRLLRKRIVFLPFTPETHLALTILANIWMDKESPRLILKSIRKRDRRKVLENLNNSKVETYILSLFNNVEGRKYRTKAVQEIVRAYLKVYVTVDEIKILRRKAAYLRQKRMNAA